MGVATVEGGGSAKDAPPRDTERDKLSMQDQFTTSPQDAQLNILTWPKRIAKGRLRVHVWIPGEPPTKQRPGFRRQDARAYTPAKTREGENAVAWSIRAEHRALMVDETAEFGVRALFRTSTRQRRDIDNMCKLVLDACTDLVWADDSQVIELIAHVLRAESKPGIELAIYTLGTSTVPTRSCMMCERRFPVYPSWEKRKYCSRVCSGLATRTGSNVECGGCGKKMHRAAHRIGGKGNRRFFCSQKCLTQATTLSLTCESCGRPFRRPQSLVRKGARTFCSTDCHQTYWREHRTKAAKGICSDCGGPTSKKSYQRCQACQIAIRTTSSRYWTRSGSWARRR